MENTNIKNEEKKQPKTPKQMTLFVLRIVGNVLFYSAIAVLFFFSLMNINAGRKNGIPNIFGNGYLRVLTNSMHVDEDRVLPEEYNSYKIKQFNCTEYKTVAGKDKITYKGDVVNVKMINNKYIHNKLKVGDVITYWDENLPVGNDKGGFNTHRIISLEKDSNGNIIQLVTMGDRYVSIFGMPDDIEASIRYDLERDGNIKVFVEGGELDNIKAVVTSVNYKAGYTVYWIQQNWLFIFVIPLAVILAIEVALVVRNIILLRREKTKGATPEGQGIDLESEKERLRKELLAELQSQGVIVPATAEEKIVDEKPELEVEGVTEKIDPTETTVEEATEEKVEDTAVEAEEAKEEAVEASAEPEAQEEVKEEKAAEEAPVEEAPAAEEATKEEEPVVNNEEAVKEPDMSIEENEEEPKAEEKKAPAKKAPSKKTSTTKKVSTTKKTEK